MSDYISKSTVIELIESKMTDGCLGTEEDTFIGGHGLVDDISDLPTLDEKEIIRKYGEPIMRFPTVEEMAKDVAEKVLDEYEYEGKTIRQWVDILKDYDDKKSTLERIVQKLEEEKSDWNYDYNVPLERAIKIVKKEGAENAATPET